MPATSNRHLGLVALCTLLMMVPGVCSAGIMGMAAHGASSMEASSGHHGHRDASGPRWASTPETMDPCGPRDCCGVAARAGFRENDGSVGLEAIALVADALITPPARTLEHRAVGPPRTGEFATSAAPLRL